MRHETMSPALKLYQIKVTKNGTARNERGVNRQLETCCRRTQKTQEHPGRLRKTQEDSGEPKRIQEEPRGPRKTLANPRGPRKTQE